MDNLDLQRVVCVCNGVTAKEVLELIKAEKITSLDELLEQDTAPVGDKCESCREDGHEDDGFSLKMLLEVANR